MNATGLPCPVVYRNAFAAETKALKAELSSLKYNHALEVECLRKKNMNWQELVAEKDRIFQECFREFRVENDQAMAKNATLEQERNLLR